jgi:hypothetical protein
VPSPTKGLLTTTTDTWVRCRLDTWTLVHLYVCTYRYAWCSASPKLNLLGFDPFDMSRRQGRPRPVTSPDPAQRRGPPRGVACPTCAEATDPFPFTAWDWHATGTGTARRQDSALTATTAPTTTRYIVVSVLDCSSPVWHTVQCCTHSPSSALHWTVRGTWEEVVCPSTVPPSPPDLYYLVVLAYVVLTVQAVPSPSRRVPH